MWFIPPGGTIMHPRRAFVMLLTLLLFISPPIYSAEAPSLTYNSSNFSIAYTDRDRDRLAIVLDMLERSYHQITQSLNFHPSDPLRVTLHATDDYLTTHPNLPPDTPAFYSSRDRTIHVLYAWTPHRSTADDRMQTFFSHEMTHAFVHAITPATIPSWFNEGLAAYHEYATDGGVRLATVTRDLRAGILPPLEQSPYQAGFAAIHYLVDRYGMSTVTAILVETRRQRFPDAFRTILGMDVPAFEREFRNASR
jgi:hypothetical protein